MKMSNMLGSYHGLVPHSSYWNSNTINSVFDKDKFILHHVLYEYVINFNFFKKKKQAEPTVKCEKCGATFQNEDMMYAHLKNTHPQNEGTEEKKGE